MPAALELVDSSPLACSRCSCSCVRKSRGGHGGEGATGRYDGDSVHAGVSNCQLGPTAQANAEHAASVEWLDASLQSPSPVSAVCCLLCSVCLYYLLVVV